MNGYVYYKKNMKKKKNLVKTPYAIQRASFQNGTRTRPDRLAQAKQNEPDTTNLTDMRMDTNSIKT